MSKMIDSYHNVKFIDDGIEHLNHNPQPLVLDGIIGCDTLTESFFFNFLDCQGGWVKNNHSFYCKTSYGRHVMKNARQRCKEMSADLPIIKSQSENDFIHRLMEEEDIEYVWLGMERNNSGFFWFDGSPAEPSQGALYSAWKNNELEQKYWGSEKCALLELNTKKWKDDLCYYWEKIYVLCQKGCA